LVQAFKHARYTWAHGQHHRSHRSFYCRQHFRPSYCDRAGVRAVPEQRQQYMPSEVPATLKLYLDGKIEQFWFRENAAGVIFLLNVESVEQAKAAVDGLPLTAAGLLTFDLMAVGPLAPLGLLIHGKQALLRRCRLH
jgi:hypothetical protein